MSDGRIGLFKRWKGDLPPHYEVVKFKHFDAKVMPNGVLIPEGERYPSPHRWGLDGYTYMDLEKAKQRYYMLIKGEKRVKNWIRSPFEPYYTTLEWGLLSKACKERDHQTCRLCGGSFSQSKLIAHHIIPRKAGGPDVLENLMSLCLPCHGRVEGALRYAQG